MWLHEEPNLYYTTLRKHKHIVRGGDKKVMDFSNRSTQQPQPAHTGAAFTNNNASVPNRPGKDVKRKLNSKWGRIGTGVALICIGILVAAVVGLLVLGGGSQDKYVNGSKYQAVFLTNGQVYFGHIKNINGNFIDLQNIYYLQSQNSSSSSSSSSNNVTLIKLGCELHAPYDQMVINMSQVSFWENIQDNGQVGKGIAQLKTCTQSSSTTQSSNSAQSSTQNSTPTAPSSSSSTKKP